MNKTIVKYRPIKVIPPEGKKPGYLRPVDILFDNASEAKGYIASQKECHDYLLEEVTLTVREKTYNADI